MQGMQETIVREISKVVREMSKSTPLPKHPYSILKLENQQPRLGKEAQEEDTGLWAQEE